MQISCWSLRARNSPKLISMYLKDNMQNQTISELYTDDKKIKYSCNSNDILKSAKIFYKKFFYQGTTSKTATSELFVKILKERKSQMNNFTFAPIKFF